MGASLQRCGDKSQALVFIDAGWTVRSMTLPAVDTSYGGIVRFSFLFGSYTTQSCASEPRTPGKAPVLEVSTDGGRAWRTLFNLSTADDKWQASSINVSTVPYARGPTTVFRFRQQRTAGRGDGPKWALSAVSVMTLQSSSAAITGTDSVSPRSAPINTAVTVRLTGRAFTSKMQCMFGTEAVNITVVGDVGTCVTPLVSTPQIVSFHVCGADIVAIPFRFYLQPTTVSVFPPLATLGSKARVTVSAVDFFESAEAAVRFCDADQLDLPPTTCASGSSVAARTVTDPLWMYPFAPDIRPGLPLVASEGQTTRFQFKLYRSELRLLGLRTGDSITGIRFTVAAAPSFTLLQPRLSMWTIAESEPLRQVGYSGNSFMPKGGMQSGEVSPPGSPLPPEARRGL